MGRSVAAARAESLDLDLVTEDHEVRGSGCLLLEVPGDPDGQVVHAATGEATDVVVALNVAVEPHRPRKAADLPNEAKGGEALEVAVDGA